MAVGLYHLAPDQATKTDTHEGDLKQVMGIQRGAVEQ